MNLLVGSVTQVLIHILILVAGNTPVKGAVCENFYSKHRHKILAPLGVRAIYMLISCTKWLLMKHLAPFLGLMCAHITFCFKTSKWIHRMVPHSSWRQIYPIYWREESEKKRRKQKMLAIKKLEWKNFDFCSYKILKIIKSIVKIND